MATLEAKNKQLLATLEALSTVAEKDLPLKMCEALEQALDAMDVLKAYAETRQKVRALVEAAYEDCTFVHCYLSVAEDAHYALLPIEQEGVRQMGVLAGPAAAAPPAATVEAK